MITFDPNGGPLSVEIKCLTPQRMAYDFYLWEAASNALVMERKGNNQNPADDIYQLPTPVGSNSGRLIQFDAAVYEDTGAGKPYEVAMIVYQDGAKVGTVSASGKTTGTSTMCSAQDRLS